MTWLRIFKMNRKLKKKKFNLRRAKRIARRDKHQEFIAKVMRKLGGYLNPKWEVFISRIARKIQKRLKRNV